MWRKSCGALCIAAWLASGLSAEIIVFQDDFDSYANDSELWFTWEPARGDGTFPPDDLDAGILTSDDNMFPGIQGQAVAHIGGAINQWFPFPEFFDPRENDSVLEPTEEYNIVFGGDVFLSTSNSRLTIGLRSNAPANILEIGGYNTDVRTLAYRLVLFESGNVDWQFFDLPSEFDANEDGTVSLGEIGPAWHRFQATVSLTEVTFEVDVFRDGTVDATAVVPATPHPAYFDSFRIGGPSGVGSTGEGAFDNVFLKLVEVQPGGGEGIPGDYNNNGAVEQADLDLVLLNWGNTAGAVGPSGSAAAGAIPEPATAALAVVAGLGLFLTRRCRRGRC